MATSKGRSCKFSSDGFVGHLCRVDWNKIFHPRTHEELRVQKHKVGADDDVYYDPPAKIQFGNILSRADTTQHSCSGKFVAGISMDGV